MKDTKLIIILMVVIILILLAAVLVFIFVDLPVTKECNETESDNSTEPVTIDETEAPENATVEVVIVESESTTLQVISEEPENTTLEVIAEEPEIVTIQGQTTQF